MATQRRKFLQYGLCGGAGFLLAYNPFRPAPTNAFVMGLLFRALLNVVFRASQARERAWWEQRREAQLAQREYVRQSFTNVSVAQVTSDNYNLIAAAERRDSTAKNVCFAFPRIDTRRVSIASAKDLAQSGAFQLSYLSGPASWGITKAAEYLQQEYRMDPRAIQASLLPALDGGFSNNFQQSWATSSSMPYPNDYSDTGVRVGYEAIDPRPGGHGIIRIRVGAHQVISIPPMRVDFPV